MVIFLFIVKLVAFILGTLFIGSFIHVFLSHTICNWLGISPNPKGGTYRESDSTYIGHGSIMTGKPYQRVNLGQEEPREISVIRHRLNQVLNRFVFPIVGLFLFVAIFSNHPATPTGVFEFLIEITKIVHGYLT